MSILLVSPTERKEDTMKSKLNIATLFIALSFAVAPTIANAGSIGDSVFNWPKEMPKSSAGEKQAVQYGSTATLKILKSDKNKKKTKKQ